MRRNASQYGWPWSGQCRLTPNCRRSHRRDIPYLWPPLSKLKPSPQPSLLPAMSSSRSNERVIFTPLWKACLVYLQGRARNSSEGRSTISRQFDVTSSGLSQLAGVVTSRSHRSQPSYLQIIATVRLRRAVLPGQSGSASGEPSCRHLRNGRSARHRFEHFSPSFSPGGGSAYHSPVPERGDRLPSILDIRRSVHRSTLGEAAGAGRRAAAVRGLDVAAGAA